MGLGCSNNAILSMVDDRDRWQRMLPEMEVAPAVEGRKIKERKAKEKRRKKKKRTREGKKKGLVVR